MFSPNGPLLLMVSTVVLLVVSPVHAQFHVYWGDVHGHTAISDGKGQPGRLLHLRQRRGQARFRHRQRP